MYIHKYMYTHTHIYIYILDPYNGIFQKLCAECLASHQNLYTHTHIPTKICIYPYIIYTYIHTHISIHTYI